MNQDINRHGIKLDTRTRCEIANRFVGYGNPETAKIAVFGIEEGGKQLGEDPKKDDQTLYNARNYCHDGFWHRENWPPEWLSYEMGRTENIQCYFSLKMRNKFGIKNMDIKTFWQEEFRGTHEITGNIIPIGKPKACDPYGTETLKYFGFDTSDSLRQYWDSVSNERFKLIRKAMDNLRENQGIVLFIGYCQEANAKKIIQRIYEKDGGDLTINQHTRISCKCRKSHWVGILNKSSLNPLCYFAPHPGHGHLTEQGIDKIIP